MPRSDKQRRRIRELEPKVIDTLTWSALPARAEKLQSRLANVTPEVARLKAADYIAEIKDLYRHQIDPLPFVSKGGNLAWLHAAVRTVAPAATMPRAKASHVRKSD